MINPRTWSSEELQLVKRDGSTREVKEAAAAELARREAQAGPSPAAVGSHAAFNDALMVEAAQKIDELRADNERLRALVIATATGIREVADLLAPTAPATAASLRHRADAAIEAAKEATHAK